jgi:hypothetical protein
MIGMIRFQIMILMNKQLIPLLEENLAGSFKINQETLFLWKKV